MARTDFPESMPIKERFDIIVVGGGLAGVSAAVAAARLGSKVGLVQDRPVLGGNASSENRVPILGANSAGLHAGIRYGRETGIIEEFLLENLKRNPLNSAWIRDTLLWELVKKEPNLTVYLNAQAREAVMVDAERIAGITVIQVSTEEDYSLACKVLVDCSGDGRIGADAGAIFRIGREGRDEFGESMAPEEADTGTLPSCVTFRARRLDHPVPFEPPKWAYRFSTDADLPFRRHDHLARVGGAVNTKDIAYGLWWLSCGGDWSTIDDTERIHDTLLRLVMGMWDHLKNCGDHGMDNYVLEWISPMAIRRESRRFEGDYMAMQRDVMELTLFEDRVAYSGRSIDIHAPEGMFTSGPPGIFVDLLDVWSVPFSCLYSRNISNLLFAGRNISVSHVTLGSTRVMSTCAVIGQAAGVGAHLCLKHQATPREVRKHHIGELQQLLLKQGCYIPCLKNEDPADLARGARVRASSEAQLATLERAERFVPLDTPLAQLFPVSADRIERIALLLESTNPSETQLRLGLRRAERINDFFAKDDIAECYGTMPGAGVHWVTFELGVDVEPGGLYWVWLPGTEGVRWGLQEKPPLGTNRAHWGQLGDRERAPWGDNPPEWFSDRGGFLFRLAPSSWPYAADSIINGMARPETWPNAWISNPSNSLPQWVDLDFGQVQTVDTVILGFDSDLEPSLVHRLPRGLFGCGAVPQLVRDYKVYYHDGYGWRPLLSVKGNYQWHRVHEVEPVQTDKLRVEVLGTNGLPSARIYQVRVYNSNP